MRIFITGGAGFLGRALIAHFKSIHTSGTLYFTVYSRDEAKHAYARHMFPDVNFIIGDVTDYQRLEAAMVGHDLIIHTAAMKYVPQAESNVREAIRVNVKGSENVGAAAIAVRAHQVIAISTDKACRPLNVYGLTKLMMERLWQEFDGITPTEFKVVRYGNVISSTGSVIPIFRRQARERKVTITNPQMTRFWLTVREACEMVYQSATVQPRGTVLVERLRSTDMLIVAKAAAAVELGGQHGSDRIDFVTVGDRFGEKVHEELLAPHEVPYTERVDRTMYLHRVVDGKIAPDDKGSPLFYTSHTPDHWINLEEMIDLIRDADSIGTGKAELK